MKPDRPYGRHPATVTADRLLDACERWSDRLAPSERDAIGVVRAALQRIAEPKPLAPCGTVAAWVRHRKHGEPADDACRAAKTAAMAEYRAQSARNSQEAPNEQGS